MPPSARGVSSFKMTLHIDDVVPMYEGVNDSLQNL